MKRFLTFAGIALAALVLVQCSQTAPTAPDTKQVVPEVQTDNGGHPGSTTPVTLAEEDTLPGHGP